MTDLERIDRIRQHYEEVKSHEQSKHSATNSPSATVATMKISLPETKVKEEETLLKEAQGFVSPSGDFSSFVSRCFDQQELLQSLHSIYPAPRIRSSRISRLEEKSLGVFMLDAVQAMFLGVENLGVFVGECGDLNKVVGHLKGLDSASSGGTWVVVPFSKHFAELIWSVWDLPAKPALPACVNPPAYWASSKVIFSTPETYIPR